MSIYDHAATRFHQIVASVLSPVPVVWSRFGGEVSYPWCRLQVVNGPTTIREQKRSMALVQAMVQVSAGAPGDVVSALVGGRYLKVAHTGTAATTATALAALAPSHWTALAVGDTVTFTGSDIFAASAHELTVVATLPTGDPQRVEVLRREAVIQTTIWCQLNRDTGRPARWDPTGCDAMALRAQTALRQIEPDPYRVYILPQTNLRPFDESYSDGREYIGTSFDTRVTWVDIDAEIVYDEPTEFIESVSGEIETGNNVDDPIIDEFDVSIDD